MKRIVTDFFAAKIIGKTKHYFLWELTQDQLSRAYFPLGEMLKSEVRDIARENNLYVAEKQESQEICFVPDGKYSEFIDRFLDHENRADELPKGGEIVNAKGEKIGEHTGIHRYTIGQRRGLGIAHEKPLYVVQIERAKNQIIAGEKEELDSLEFIAKGVNWVAFDEPKNPVRASVKVRYRHDPGTGDDLRAAGKSRKNRFRRTAIRHHARTSDCFLRRRRSVSAAAGLLKHNF